MTNETATKCAGCGVAIQTESPEKLGYTPPAALTKETVLCQRCFRIKNYNEISSVTPNQDDFLKILGGIGEKRALVVHIVDLFDFEGSLIAGLHRFIGQNPVILVVNKIDLLPKAINVNRILNWVQKQAKENGIRTSEVVLCSAKKNIGFDRVIEAISSYRGDRDVYVVGATNVGKSTLINRIIREYSDLEAELTTSPFPGTTLDLVQIPLDDGRYMIDTPGIVYSHRLTEIIDKQDLKTVLPDKPIKPSVFQLNEKQTLFFGAFARFDFVQGQRQSFTCYVSNAVPIHRTKLDNADDLYAAHKGEMLSPPTADRIGDLPPLVKHAYRIPKGSSSEVLISGLGWIAVNSDAGAQIVIHAPKGVKVAVRSSLI
ncbi:ribosome biogenesis GTPase YqeH [Paenibacillus ginsengarvi]|uniref:Ribosome biogenesis GTPase YqeH n=1 Tax=Paenibacillus ginsengarvi TaxID=400777 RepID=A0A3B0C5N3_9BACL|nr:ribosome biogenesis GTPase YqeH [Paenibacillus ginsengarvi]RKN79057.1 ribosome biogenesis GTPase YqeH [Paenibacillus ginsengarvi]